MCLFCNYDEHARYTAQSLLANLLKQLAQERNDVSKVIRQLYHSYSMKRTSATLCETVRALKSELQTYKKVYIVIDALDECPQKARETLLQNLQSLLDTPGTVSLMITTRPNTAIKEIREIRRLEIRAEDEDVGQYVRSRIEHSTRLRNNVSRDPELEKMIIDKLIRNANGM